MRWYCWGHLAPGFRVVERRRLGRSRASCPARQTGILPANLTPPLRGGSFNSLQHTQPNAKGRPFRAALLRWYWWRRRELNPRPSALCLPVYMLRPFFSVNPSAVRRPGSLGRVHFDLTLCPRTRYSTRGSVIYCATHPEPSKLCSLTFKRLERSFRRWQLC